MLTIRNMDKIQVKRPRPKRKGLAQHLLFYLYGLSLILASALLTLPSNASLPQELSGEKLKHLHKGRILTNTEVEDFAQQSQKMQKLEFYIAGLHERSCDVALRKLSQYEKYQEFLTFVEKSEYLEPAGRIQLLLASPLLPVKMLFNVQIPRIQTPGQYPFEFDRGFLKGLTGLIRVIAYDKRCLFYTTAHWQGPHSGYPNTVFEFFSNALSKLAMEKLFHISRL